MHSSSANGTARILAIETSGSVCSVCLIHGERFVAEYTLDIPNAHDRMLATLVERILSESSCPAAQLDAIAVSSGPGSFTGLRIGFAFAKGMCLANDIVFIAVPTLHACAYASVPIASLIADCDIAALIHARDDRWFAQHFTSTGEPLTDPYLACAEEIGQRISSNTLLCGPGAAAFRRGLHVPGLARLSARFVARLALQRFREGNTSDQSTATPLYVEEFNPRATAGAPHSP